MANDYKPTPSARGGAKPAGRPMNPMFLGVIIGLLLGIVIALGIAIWVARNSGNFPEKAKPVEPLPTIAPKPVVAAPTTPAVPGKETKDGKDKPRFEFYDILPGDKSGKASGAPPKTIDKAADKAADAQKTAQDTKRDTQAARAATDTPTPAVGKENYFLQAGAFQNESDADNMKAQIAFAGLEAFVKSVNVPAKGTLYRVRLGPFKSLDEVNRARATLSQNGIDSAVVKAE